MEGEELTPEQILIKQKVNEGKIVWAFIGANRNGSIIYPRIKKNMKTKEEILNKLCEEQNHMQTLVSRAVTLLAMEEYADQFRQTNVISSNVKHSFGGIDKSGNIKCDQCGEYTNEYYLIVPNMVCWNCNSKLLGSHVDTIKDLQMLIRKNCS